MWLGAYRDDDGVSQALTAGLKQPLTSLERALEAVCILGVALCFALPLIAWGRLPDRVPTHFGASGQADGFGPKSALFNLAWVQLGMWLFLSLITPLLKRLSPRYWNMPIRVTAENATRVAGALRVSMLWLKLLMVWTFTLLQFQMVDSALTGSNTMGTWMMPLLLALPIASILVIGLSFANLYRSDRSQA